MSILKELLDGKWKDERLKGCTCPTEKRANSKCPIHGLSVTEGFSGLTVGGSDSAADLAYDMTGVIVRELRKALKDKGNQYNTDGVMNVAMIIGERLQPWASEDHLQDLAKDVLEKLEKSDWKGQAGYAGVVKRLKAFIAKGD